MHCLLHLRYFLNVKQADALASFLFFGDYNYKNI